MSTTNFLIKSIYYSEDEYQFIGNYSLEIHRRKAKIKPRLHKAAPLVFLIGIFYFFSGPQIMMAQVQVTDQQQPENYQISKYRNKFKLAEIPQLQKKVEYVYPGGSMKIFEEVSLSNNEIVKLLNVGNESTFIKQTEQASRFESGISLVKFQQFYKGIKVENGGYAIKTSGKLPDGSFEVRQFSPFMLYDLNLDTTPSIQKSEISKILGDRPIEEYELIISDRFSGDFQLIWKVRFRDPQTKYAWLDANTGKTIKIDDGVLDINGPTEDYGSKPMNDVNIGNTKFLQTNIDPVSNGGVITYDFDLKSYFEIGIPEYTSDLIPTTNALASEWTSDDADESVFQAHWIVNQLREKYLTDFGIDYRLLHIGANCDNCFNIIFEEEVFCISDEDPAAGTFKVSTLNEGWIKFSHSEESTLAEYDVLGHELAHVYMNELLNPYAISSLSLQEGIADMFGVYMESEIQSLDWDMGDDVPFIVRNLKNPVFTCFNEAAMNSTEEHDRGSALSYWFYNLVTEDEIDCGQALDMKTVLDVIIDALVLVPFNADYPELCTATLTIAEQQFGLQSTEYTAILGAWNKICVNPIGGPPLGPPLYIQISQTWATDMTIDYDIYIEKGATLTVTSTLTMVPEVDIYVEDDSELVVDGGTLTTDNCQMWNGIHVAGEFDFYSPFSEDEFKKGRVYLKNGALLERAITGIDAKDKFVTYQGKVYEFGGGIVDVRNSTINECVFGIRFGRYGWSSVFGSGIYDDQSYISNSFFESNHNAIYSEYNIGVEIHYTSFSPHRINYEGIGSKIRATHNTLAHGIVMKSPYPVVPGSKIIYNTFDGLFLTESQGNHTPLVLYNNKFNGANLNQLGIVGESYFQMQHNEFNWSNISCFLENTGINRRNIIKDNAFNVTKKGNSIFGENDIEFLTNCFSETSITDIELNDGASIYFSQGQLTRSAGNCFEDGARIKNGTGTGGFLYWTHDGYGNPTVCEHPGSGNFTVEFAQTEASHDDCGVILPIIGDPPICECSSGTNGCIIAIEGIRNDITSTQGNQTLSQREKNILIAEFERCLDELIRHYIDTVSRRGDVEDVITFLANQPEFQYRIMAYGIMNSTLDYDRSRAYLDTLSVSEDFEEEFVMAQNLYLDYIIDIDSFVLQPTDSILLRQAGEKYNPYAGYARAIYYLLTHKLIEREFIHLDNTVTIRSLSERDTILPVSTISIYPNPSELGLVNISIQNFSTDKIYSADVYNQYGQRINRLKLNGDNSQIKVGEVPGLYIIVISTNDEIRYIDRVFRL